MKFEPNFSWSQHLLINDSKEGMILDRLKVDLMIDVQARKQKEKRT